MIIFASMKTGALNQSSQAFSTISFKGLNSEYENSKSSKSTLF